MEWTRNYWKEEEEARTKTICLPLLKGRHNYSMTLRVQAII